MVCFLLFHFFIPQVDAVDGLLSRKVRGRAEELLRLRLDVFVGAFGRLLAFEEQALVGGRELKIVLNSLVRQYVEQLHRNQCASVSAVLDNERWVSVAVPLEFQKIVHRLCATTDLPEEALDRLDALVVDGERFCVVAAALVCVQAVSQYVQCANALPSVANEAMGLLAKVFFFFFCFRYFCLLIIFWGAAVEDVQLQISVVDLGSGGNNARGGAQGHLCQASSAVQRECGGAAPSGAVRESGAGGRGESRGGAAARGRERDGAARARPRAQARRPDARPRRRPAGPRRIARSPRGAHAEFVSNSRKGKNIQQANTLCF